MIGVMLRGRHRGLPVAIDRYVSSFTTCNGGMKSADGSAILLPQEMARIDRKKASESTQVPKQE
jgi:hypothetical protein